MARRQFTVQQLRQFHETRELLASGEARRIREESDLTFTRLALMANVAAMTIRRWESGAVPHAIAPAIRYGRVLKQLRDEPVRSS
jgi:DNA-binding transcriptional regulator YiaG